MFRFDAGLDANGNCPAADGDDKFANPRAMNLEAPGRFGRTGVNQGLGDNAFYRAVGNVNEHRGGEEAVQQYLEEG